MIEANPIAAELLETSAAGYASAANALLQQAPDKGVELLGSSAEWKAHLTQRILELATAIRVNEPNLFVRRVSWLRRAMKARGADESGLRTALQSLRTALNQELPEGLRSTIDHPIQLALDTLDSEAEPEIQTLDASTLHGKLGLEYLSACLEARTETAVTLILEAIENGLVPQEAYTRVLLPAQREIGQLWHIGDVSIAEERLVSETTRDVMSLIVNRYAPSPDPARTVLEASVAGNAHDIGLRAVADLFKLAGWHSVFLGADMPTAEIATAARSLNARLVVLAATLTTQIAALSAAIEGIRQVSGGAKILVGGLALEGSPELWKQLGADEYAPDVESAVEIGARLVANG